MPVCLLSTGLRKWIGHICNSRKLTFSPPRVNEIREKGGEGNKTKKKTVRGEPVSTCMPYDYKFCLHDSEQYVFKN